MPNLWDETDVPAGSLAAHLGAVEELKKRYHNGYIYI